MYKINTTHQFEKDLKRCIKRGYPTWTSSVRSSCCWNVMAACLQNTIPTCCMAIAKASGSAISSPTGCSSGNNMTMFWSC